MTQLTGKGPRTTMEMLVNSIAFVIFDNIITLQSYENVLSNHLTTYALGRLKKKSYSSIRTNLQGNSLQSQPHVNLPPSCESIPQQAAGDGVTPTHGRPGLS